MAPKQFCFKTQTKHTEAAMITCKLCNTKLTRKNFRRDGSLLCPVCGQVYWKAAVEKVLHDPTDSGLRHRSEIRK